jgi:hypothetical protein
MGTHPRGALLALVGDDPAAKSSSASTRGCRCAATVPGASEFLLADLGMPTLYAADPQGLGRPGDRYRFLTACMNKKHLGIKAEGLAPVSRHDGTSRRKDTVLIPALDRGGARRSRTFHRRQEAEPNGRRAGLGRAEAGTMDGVAL